MNHFDHGGQNFVLAANLARCAGGQQQQGRAEPLAAQLTAVLKQFVDKRGIVPQLAGQPRLDAFQVAQDGQKESTNGGRKRGLMVHKLTHDETILREG
jgi:hypothetical protein